MRLFTANEAPVPNGASGKLSPDLCGDCLVAKTLLVVTTIRKYDIVRLEKSTDFPKSDFLLIPLALQGF